MSILQALSKYSFLNANEKRFRVVFLILAAAFAELAKGWCQVGFFCFFPLILCAINIAFIPQGQVYMVVNI